MANVASGSVGADAPDELAKIFADAGIQANICAPETKDLSDCLKACIDRGPDLLVILAGDGTARAAAEACGPDGPMIAPLPGGTMNMLPHAIYGVRSWQDALTIALAQGEERIIGGGDIEGRRFLVAAILGSPALWAPAREAARFGEFSLAIRRARRALRRAFEHRLRYVIDNGGQEKAEALVFMCPVASRALSEEDQALEAAALNVRGATDAVRLGLNALVRDWRADPSVETEHCRLARIWSNQGVPAILDGESVRLKKLVEIRWEPRVARILGLPKDV